MWPFKRKPKTAEWAREIAATIPQQDLVNHAETFADCAIRDRNPQRRAMHLAKFRATMRRLEIEARFDSVPEAPTSKHWILPLMFKDGQHLATCGCGWFCSDAEVSVVARAAVQHRQEA